MAQTRMPAASYKKKLLRLPADILDVLEEEAAQQERSLNGQIVHALRAWYAKEQERHRASRTDHLSTSV